MKTTKVVYGTGRLAPWEQTPSPEIVAPLQSQHAARLLETLRTVDAVTDGMNAVIDGMDERDRRTLENLYIALFEVRHDLAALADAIERAHTAPALRVRDWDRYDGAGDDRGPADH